MENFDRRLHWENIYNTKQANEVSWYQPTPVTALEFIKELMVPASAKIIDIGGGDSFLVDHLIESGFKDLAVLDISEAAINKAKERLGFKAEMVDWIVTDVVAFQPKVRYDFWHDRAAFHFLTKEDEIDKYISIVESSIRPGGLLVIGTFSENGPQKCSGIEVRQYSEESMATRLKESFEKIKCITIDHITPFDKLQNFIFCSFRRK